MRITPSGRSTSARAWKWIDSTGAEVADVTAHDWVAAAHYILDAHNDSGNEYNWEVAKVVGAADYYAYTAYQLALESATTAPMKTQPRKAR